MRQKTKNTRMLELIQELKKASIENDAAIWKRIAEDLEKPNRKQRIVNVYSIARNAKDGETVIVPGKVLGTGDIDKEVVVAAYNFSDSAYQKLKSSGKVLTIKELIKKNPEGKNVRILG